METMPESVLSQIVSTLMSNLSKFLGITVGTNLLKTTSQSGVLNVLGVTGPGTSKYIYTRRDFLDAIEEFPEFTRHINTLLRKRNCDYGNLERLVRLSNTVIVQINRNSSKGSIIFVGLNKKLLYLLSMVGAQLFPVKNEMEVLSSGGTESF